MSTAPEAAPHWTLTRVTALLGVRYPIIQGALGGISTQRLAAVVSNAGGLGSYGAHGQSGAAIRDIVSEIKALTEKPFAINLWLSMADDGAERIPREVIAESVAALGRYYAELGVEPPSPPEFKIQDFDDQIRAVFESRPAVFSFILGVPPQEILDECKRLGIVTMGTATTPEEAVALDVAKVDLIVASGFEAGGHRGSFLRPAERSLTGSIALIPRVVDAVQSPVIAAGGIADARGMVAAFALGAEAVQIGTAFLACDESGASAQHRGALFARAGAYTDLTKTFTGRLARGIRNRLMDELETSNLLTLPYPLQRSLIKTVVAAAQERDQGELMQLWAGQSMGLVRHHSAAALVASLVADGHSLLHRMAR
jgi:nitronate monooxygenase